MDFKRFFMPKNVAPGIVQMSSNVFVFHLLTQSLTWEIGTKTNVLQCLLSMKKSVRHLKM